MHKLSRMLLHRRWFHKPDGFQALEINYLLVQLASNMVAGFGVLFVYQFGSNLAEGIWWVGLFYGLQRLVVASVLHGVAHLISKYGYRKIMLLAVFSLIFKLWFLSMASIVTWGYLFAALVFGGVSIGAYYLVFHGMFLDDNDDSKVGEQMGLLTMLGRLSGVVSPFLAGLIVERWGFSWMFLLAMVLLLLSTIPLWFMPHHKHKGKGYSLKKVGKILSENKMFSWSVVLWYVTDGIQIFLWPIFMYAVLGSFASFGAVGSLAMLFNAAAVYMAGKVYDKRPLRRGFPGFSLLVSLTWVMRFLSFNTLTLVTANTLNRSISPLWWMKIRRGELSIGEKYNSLVFAVSHELLCSVAYGLSILIGVGALYLSDYNWLTLIPVVVIGTWLSSAVLYREKRFHKW